MNGIFCFLEGPETGFFFFTIIFSHYGITRLLNQRDFSGKNHQN